MATHVLSQASAFNPGADLWIVPDLEKSHWTSKLDWYLNFQICKSSRHVTQQRSPFLDKIISESEIESFTNDLGQETPLMISSGQLLPNKWVVVLPWTNDLEKWSSRIAKIWSDLGKPSLRVFLPTGQSTSRFQQFLSNPQELEDFSVVLD